MLLVGLLTSAGSSTRAAECSSASTQADINACSARRFEHASAALGKVYAALAGKQGAAGWHRLRALTSSPRAAVTRKQAEIHCVS